MMSQIVHRSQPTPVLFRPSHQPFATNYRGCINVPIAVQPSTCLSRSIRKCRNNGLTLVVKAAASSAVSSLSSAGPPDGPADYITETRAVKAVVSVLPTATRIFQDVASRVQDDITDLLGKSLHYKKKPHF
ncbi:unnamed protein product [Rhodiola kirilowii]